MMVWVGVLHCIVRRMSAFPSEPKITGYKRGLGA